MKKLAPDHNPALRGRRIVIRLKRQSEAIFEGGDMKLFRSANKAQAPEMTRDEIIRMARLAVEEEGWPWVEPVMLTRERQFLLFGNWTLDNK